MENLTWPRFCVNHLKCIFQAFRCQTISPSRLEIRKLTKGNNFFNPQSRNGMSSSDQWGEKGHWVLKQRRLFIAFPAGGVSSATCRILRQFPHAADIDRPLRGRWEKYFVPPGFELMTNHSRACHTCATIGSCVHEFNAPAGNI